jgi:nicotinamidase/pyrazinamidase
VGLATDYCVRASALDALEHGQHVRILRDLVAGVAAESSEAALAELGHAGAEIVESGALPTTDVVEAPEETGTAEPEADAAGDRA